MPYHISLPLQHDPDRSFPAIPHRALQATVYDWLGTAEPALAARVHDLPEQKPFTVAPLHRREGTLYLTFTLLDDDLWPPIRATLQAGARLEIEDGRWPINWAERQEVHVSYPELVVSAGLDTRLAFRFRSPTSFRSQDMHYPLPDPTLVFQSWLLRWNAFAPEQLRLNVNTLDLVGAHVAVSRHRIETCVVHFHRYAQVGFVGSVTYQVVKRERLGDDLLRRLNVLANYAPFCGTGHKTTQGMGHTQRLR